MPTARANFDVSPDGSRIVIPVSQSESYQLIVVPNWLTQFRQRMAAASKRYESDNPIAKEQRHP